MIDTSWRVYNEIFERGRVSAAEGEGCVARVQSFVSSKPLSRVRVFMSTVGVRLET